MTLIDADGRPEHCFECGEPAEHRHHVIPRSKGGTRTVPLCEVCHDLVHFRNDDTGSLLRHAYLSAKVAVQAASPVAPPAPSETAVDDDQRPAPPGMTWLPNWPFPVSEAALEVTDGDRERAAAGDEPAEFYAQLRAKMKSRRRS